MKSIIEQSGGVGYDSKTLGSEAGALVESGMGGMDSGVGGGCNGIGGVGTLEIATVYK